ncbi:MAG: peptidyl-prolyl cis-trans isomerase SurA [Candidatus Azotimanducaceae bacterium]|jgi:peptidyl-prolyl cis-trans isomerase SurA|tara:strand:- start:11359 stop:12660 length:1302 start_codon:yes stop_codon:yes gene_type:complete
MGRMNYRSIIGILSLSILALAPVNMTLAAYEKLEAIIAVVDDDVVLVSELVARLGAVRQSMLTNGVTPPPNDILVSQIVERLIIENIQKQEAERRGVTIDDETLTRAVAQFAQNNNMTLQDFQQQLINDGTSFRQFREDIRAEMVISRLQRAMINRRISISDQDVQGLLNSPFYKQLFSDEYRVGHIMITLDDEASSEIVQQAVESADAMVADLRGGENFAQTAIARSSASSALEGGDLGWRKAGELPTLFTEAVLEMQLGDVSDPIVSGSTVHVIKLLEQRGAGTERLDQTKVRHILLRPSEIRTLQEAQAIAVEVREKLVAGGDFEALAKEYSEDPGSALNGGDLGWATPDQFVGIFAQTMDATAIGAISEPFESQYGWHVLTVEGRREEDMSEDARRNMAVDLLHRRRFEEERQEWLKEIRDEAFVELRL